MPGIVFRMEVESNPARTIYALRVDPKLILAESRLAGDFIYEDGKTNGRGTVSEMVRQTGAIGGINGDFFQWTPDPGGDPLGLALSKGQLISAPGSKAKNVALGWGPSLPYTILSPTYTSNVKLDGNSDAIAMLNGRVPKDGLGLNFDVAAAIYGEEPMTAVRLALPKGHPTLQGKFSGKVIEVLTEHGKLKIPKGEAVLGACGIAKEKVKNLKPGDDVEFEIKLGGIPNGITEAMGGWPVLLKKGAYSGPIEKPNSARHPRTAVGVTSDGKIWQVVIDGRQTTSIGATFTETATIMARLGCVEAINLDGGGSSAINFMGMTLNRPSGGVERSVANGILLFAPRIAQGDSFQIIGPQQVLVGSTISLKAAGSQTIWSAQGGAWIDQDGLLRGMVKGEAKVSALAQGRIVTRVIQVVES